MQKRGISPIIATVLVIFFVVILGTIVMMWVTGFFHGIQKSSETASEETMACSNANIRVKYSCIRSGDTIVMMVENMGLQQISGLNVRMMGASSGYQNLTKIDLGPASLKKVEVPIDASLSGLKDVEVLPIAYVGHEIMCNQINKITPKPC